MQGTSSLGRRRFLATFTVPAILAVVPLSKPAFARPVRDRTLRLHHRVTGESLKATYLAEGRLQEDELRRISWLMRDWRVTRARNVDPELLDLLWSLDQRLDAGTPIEVLCGYRTPETNAKLRREHSGVARNSLHVKAMAVDLRVKGRSLEQVRSAAISLKGGGVGYYPASDFVHVDCGSVRTW